MFYVLGNDEAYAATGKAILKGPSRCCFQARRKGYCLPALGLGLSRCPPTSQPAQCC